MAILRGGTRIFGQDIRIGMPRDKSLVNVAGDKRLKRRLGNVGSTIGQFIATVSQGEGVARPSRYLVKFFLNKNLKIGNFGQINHMYKAVAWKEMIIIHQEKCKEILK